jgi:hypothetical protein
MNVYFASKLYRTHQCCSLIIRAGHRQWKKWATTDTDNQQPHRQPTPIVNSHTGIRQSTVTTQQPTLHNQKQLSPTDTPDKQNKHPTTHKNIKRKCERAPRKINYYNFPFISQS